MLPLLFVGISDAGNSGSLLAWLLPLLVGLLSAGLVALAAYRLMYSRIAYKGLTLISVPVIFVLAFVLLVNRVTRNNEKAEASYLHSKEVIAQTDVVLENLQDAETSVRGYVITADPAFSEPFARSRRQVTEGIAQLESLVRDNPAQEARARRLETIATEKLAQLAKQDQMVRVGDRDGAIAQVKSKVGLSTMDNFRREMADFLTEEHRLDAARRAIVEESWQRFNWLLVAGSSVDILVTLLLAFLFVRGISKPVSTLTENAHALAEGKELIEPLRGTDELALLDQVFHDMARALREAQTGLEKRVQERTAELSQANILLTAGIAERERSEAERRGLEEQLVQSQKLESIGTLAGGVAHDFNNLLTVIGGNAQLGLARLPSDAPVRERLVEIEKASDRAATLTRQLLAFSRRQQLERKSISLNDTIHEIMKLLRRVIGADIEVRFNAAGRLPSVFADPSQIEQVVMNLAINARDAMPQGGKIIIETNDVMLDEVYLHNHPLAKPGRYAEIKVSDSGIGMDAQTRARIFEPFFTTKEVGKGTGLGLSMVYGIIKQHEGLIEVYSEVGHGTTFKIYLPVAENAIAAALDQTQAPLRGGSETILLAEDEEPLRVLARSVLEELGYAVLLASNGQEAVDVYTANREQIDLVILDVVMPRMGGHAAYEQIRESGSEVPVIFMTGYSVEMVRSRFVENSNTPLLQKPYSIDVFGRKVREVLDASLKI
jgi:signal transduction histidine kinase